MRLKDEQTVPLEWPGNITYPAREKLKAIGCRWNPEEKRWYVSLERYKLADDMLRRPDIKLDLTDLEQRYKKTDSYSRRVQEDWRKR